MRIMGEDEGTFIIEESRKGTQLYQKGVVGRIAQLEILKEHDQTIRTLKRRVEALEELVLDSAADATEWPQAPSCGDKGVSAQVFHNWHA
jgi:hypothetical protein